MPPPPGELPNPGIELNPGFPRCRWILYHLSHQESPKILDWVAYPFSRGSSQPRNRTGVTCIAGRLFTSWAPREAPTTTVWLRGKWNDEQAGSACRPVLRVSLQEPNWSVRQFDANLWRLTYLPWLKCGWGQLWILSLGGTSDGFVERVKKCGRLLLEPPAILPPASPAPRCLLSHRMRPVAKDHTVSYMRLFIGREQQQKVLALNSHF